MSGPEPPFHTGIMADARLDEARLAERVLAERVRVFTDRAVAGAITSPLGTLLLAVVLGPSAGWDRAAAWLCLVNLGELAILGLGYGYRAARPDDRAAIHWGRRQIAANALTGLAWGLSVWFFRVEANAPLYLLNLTVLVGVAALCLTIMAAFRASVALFTLGVLGPPLVQLAVLDIPHRGAMAAGIAILFVLVLQYGGVARRQLVSGLESGQRSLALVDKLSQLRGELFLRNTEMEARNRDLAAALERVKELATQDELTGAFNRRYIVEQLERQLALRERHGATASLVMLDIDHFKRINDRCGHAVGDQALIETVRTIAGALREGDILARFGGEEFVVLLPMTRRDAAVQLAERLRGAMRQIALAGGSGKVFLRASFGVAELGPDESVAGWLRRADQALYRAKERGRDGVVAAD